MKVQLNTRIEKDLKDRLMRYLEMTAQGRVRPGELQDLVEELLLHGIKRLERRLKKKSGK